MSHTELDSIERAVARPIETVYLCRDPHQGMVRASLGVCPDRQQLVGVLPGVTPEQLGDRSMAEAHDTRFPYICGEMANGIASVEMVQAMVQEGMLGFFGAAG